MASKRMYLRLGSISHGTLKTEDLLSALLDAADGVVLTRLDRGRINRARFERDAFDAASDDVKESAMDDLNETYEDVLDLLQCYVPPFTYLGMHPGDGSDLGVWTAIDHTDDDDLPRGDELPKVTLDSPNFFLVINDHGNATLYYRARTRWVELWAVV